MQFKLSIQVYIALDSVNILKLVALILPVIRRYQLLWQFLDFIKKTSVIVQDTIKQLLIV